MKKLILIGGVLAGGKSTFSHIVGERFGISVVNKDRVKEILGDNIKTANREENKKLSVIAFELMSYLVEGEGDTLILESNFKDYELKELKEKCNASGCDVLSLFLDGDDNVLHSRFLKRLDEDRHPVHKSQDFTRVEDFTDTLNELRGAEYFGEIVRVDCTDFSYQSDEALFDRIKVFLNK
jgi:predicted kinase